MNDDFRLPMPVKSLIPHKPPFCFIDQLLEIDDQSVTADTVVSDDNILLNDDGSLDQLVMVEMIAQTYASLQGYHSLALDSDVKRGFLVEVRKFQFGDRVHKGDRLIIKVRRKGSFGGFDMAKGEVICKDRVIASGTIKVWIPES